MMKNESVRPTEIEPLNILLRGTTPAVPFQITSRGEKKTGEDYAFYDTPDTAAEIRNLLEFNGMDYAENDGCFRLIFCSQGRKWRTAIAAQENFAIVCGEYPFSPAEFTKGFALCSRINSEIVTGCAFVSGQSLIFKTTADIFDGYYAYEAIARALEYNAGAMLHYWADAYECSQK